MHPDSLAILFIKAPLPGMVKSRLAHSIGQQAALDLYRSFILDTVDMLEKTGHDLRIFFSPLEAAVLVRELVGPARMVSPQNGADLGERMANAFQQAFAAGCTRAVLVGSDIPELTQAIVHEAFDALEQNDAVLGPAADGGYYLIGFRKEAMLPRAFHKIAWSTTSVFAETMSILRKNSRSVHLLPLLSDVDSIADLKAFWERNRNTAAQSRALEYIGKHEHDLFVNEISSREEHPSRS